MQSFTLSCVGPLFEIRAQPRHLADVVISHPTHASFGTDLLLHGYDFAYIRRDAEGNERYLVTLYWSRIGSIGRELAVSVRLRAGERQLVQVDGAPVRGCYPPSQWRTDEVVIDQYTLVLSLLQPLPDRAALFIVVYTRDDLQPLQVKETGETAFHLGAVELGQYARPTNQRPHPGSS